MSENSASDSTNEDFSCIHKHYDFGPILGEGNFSSVNLCQHRITRESVAIKVLEKNRIKNHYKKTIKSQLKITIVKAFPCLTPFPAEFFRGGSQKYIK